MTDGPLELVEVELPPGASVSYPADAYIFKYQQLWILDGHLRFHEGPVIHDLHTGDCLQLGPPPPTTFHNPSSTLPLPGRAGQRPLISRTGPGRA